MLDSAIRLSGVNRYDAEPSGVFCWLGQSVGWFAGLMIINGPREGGCECVSWLMQMGYLEGVLCMILCRCTNPGTTSNVCSSGSHSLLF